MYISNPERRIKNFVNQNNEKLVTIAEAYLNSDTSTKAYKGVKVEQVFKGSNDIVQFYYSGVGIVPASKYKNCQSNTPEKNYLKDVKHFTAVNRVTIETSNLGGGAVSVSLLRTDEEMEDAYNRYVNTVYRIALMLLKNVPDAEDVTQTVFIKLIPPDCNLRATSI